MLAGVLVYVQDPYGSHSVAVGGAYIRRRLAASYSQCCMVLLRVLNLLWCSCGSSRLDFLILRHACFISWMVQCCLGLPTRLRVPMFGRARVFWNVAILVGASSGSRRMWVNSFICACFICFEMRSSLFGGLCALFPVPFPFPFPFPVSLSFSLGVSG